ncbi:hypothetical protein LTR08_006085 [Meristemomyces frigidus]|nr:hypothetical protein LTR08_006085 [Meristemomyces frigidus]
MNTTVIYARQHVELNATEDHGVLSERNLPDYMGKIEAGWFDERDRQWVYDSRKKQPVLHDHNGNPIISSNTGRVMKRVPLLPDRIPDDVRPWLVNYWMHKAVQQGIYIRYEDVADRMETPSDKPSDGKRDNTVSMRVQRYIEGIGQLAVVEKKKGGVPAEQAMQTIEDLYIIQGQLNTWWLPNNMTARGPWIVVQPLNHPGYRERDSAYRGNSRVVEHMYGLSKRVSKLSDALIFFDVTAEEAGLPLGAQGRKALQQSDLAEDFALFQAGGQKPWLSVEHARVALENATTEKELLAILWGHIGTIRALQISPAADFPYGAVSLWSAMTDERVRFLLAIARRWSEEDQLPFEIIATEELCLHEQLRRRGGAEAPTTVPEPFVGTKRQTEPPVEDFETMLYRRLHEYLYGVPEVVP